MLQGRSQPARFVMVVIAVLAGVTGCAERHAATREAPSAIRFVDTGEEFDALIHRPAPGAANGWGVLMIGGGVGNDLDWTTPGHIIVDGAEIQTSISGQDHADAPVIARALTEAGFVVMRWSTLAVGDPLASQWPVRATPRTQAELLRQARSALATFRREGSIDPKNVLLLGHSLGAARACTIAHDDQGIRALMLLAPAYFRRSAQVPASFAASGLLHGEDVVRTRHLPCIVLVGTADASRAVDVRELLTLAGTPVLQSLELHACEGLGHQLGPQQEHLVGPIDPIVATRLAEWASAVAHQP